MQVIPGVRSLNHEAVAVYSVVLGLVVYFWAATIERDVAQPDAFRLHLVAEQITVLVVLVLSVSFGANIFGMPCKLAHGVLYFLVVFFPTAFFLGVLGRAAGLLQWSMRSRIWLVVGLVAVLILWDSVSILWGPRAIPIDPILGLLLAGDQRAAMEPSNSVFAQRIVPLLFAAIVYSGTLVALDAQKSQARFHLRFTNARHRQWVTSMTVLLVLAVVAGPSLGLRWSWAPLERALSGSHDGRYVTVHWDPTSPPDYDIQVVADLADWFLAERAAIWSTERIEPLDIWLYANEKVMVRHTGLGDDHAGEHDVHIRHRSARTSILRHELAHVLHLQNKLPQRVRFNRGLLEGAAEMVERDLDRLPMRHHEVAAGRATLPQLEDVFSLTGFWKVDERVAYHVAGSFLGWIGLSYGQESVAQILLGTPFEEALGSPLDALERQWHDFLDGLSVTPESERLGHQIFAVGARRGYLQRPCPKLGAVSRGDREAAYVAAQSGSSERAQQLFEGLLAEEPSAEVFWAYLDVLVDLEKWDDALLWIREESELTARSQISDTERRRREIEILSQAQRWKELEDLLEEENRKRDGRADPWMVLLLEPQIRERVRNALASPPYQRGALVAQLWREYPEQPLLEEWLLVSTPWAFPDIRERTDAVARYIHDRGASPVRRAEVFMSFAVECFETKEHLLLYQTARNAREITDADEVVFLAERFLARLKYLEFTAPQELSLP